MPSTRIATGEWARGRESEVIGAVQSALAEALRLPDWDRDVVLDIYERQRRIIPPGRSERYTRIEVKLFAGRSLAAKKTLYRLLVDNLAMLGVPREEVKTALVEVPRENWGIRGGLPASEVDLGFEVEV